MSINKVIEAIEHDAFSRVMNPSEDGFDGQADIEVFSGGNRWAICPYCQKKAIKILPETKAHMLPHKCKNSKCEKEFIINV